MPPQLRPMKHIDRKDLYTNLETRIQYLHSFLDFSSRDIEALITGSKYIKALIPALTRSTSYEGPVDQNLSDDSPIILHRKTFLRAYLNKLCSDPSTMEFWYYLDKVGSTTVAPALANGEEGGPYVRDGDEFADEAEAPEIEREGYLFGKRMLDDLEEEDENATGSACPFSGLTKGVSAVKISNGDNESSTAPESDENKIESASTPA
ncbi:hypothetical protein NPX13_g5476 [Xylaria arbuscula]|uniref:Globin-sensor domain-containing protein n=1 Tax=Xylaria arbuscula TaxID=114810 RepID=A0A9W8TKZ5_9PEZI|nr:hypothetical protein NPX13_g5476 [Xylaria arbuscula]